MAKEEEPYKEREKNHFTMLQQSTCILTAECIYNGTVHNMRQRMQGMRVVSYYVTIFIFTTSTYFVYHAQTPLCACLLAKLLKWWLNNIQNKCYFGPLKMNCFRCVEISHIYAKYIKESCGLQEHFLQYAMPHLE